MLTNSEKREMREMRREFVANGGFIYHNPKVRVCVVMRRTGQSMGEFSVSIMGNDEPEYDKNSGEYWALIRFCNNGEKLPFVWDPNEQKEYIAEAISLAVGNYYQIR